MESGAIGYAPRFGGDFVTHAPILLYGGSAALGSAPADAAGARDHI